MMTVKEKVAAGQSILLSPITLLRTAALHGLKRLG
jgi:hypothetical protein